MFLNLGPIKGVFGSSDYISSAVMTSVSHILPFEHMVEQVAADKGKNVVIRG